jgi:hypothetical protein
MNVLQFQLLSMDAKKKKKIVFFNWSLIDAVVKLFEGPSDSR